MSSDEPRLVTMKDFKENLADFDEPVRVIRARRGVEILGTWVPEARNGKIPARDRLGNAKRD